MDRIREFLSRRIYGVPVVAFVAIAAAILLYFALRMKKTAVAPDATDEPSGDTDPFTGDTNQPSFSASPTTPTVVAVPTADTNELWAGRARTWLVGQGTDSLTAQSIVFKYLNSQSLTAAEAVKINQVLSVLGFPPDPPEIPTPEVPVVDPVDPQEPPPDLPPTDPGPGPGSGNTPPTKQGTPPCMHTVKNARDNGPGELANLYFGNNSPATVNKIEAANLDIGNGPWSPGTKVKIPENVEPHYWTCTESVRGLNEIAGKNGVSKEYIKALNPGMDFPRPVGSKVRVR